MLKVLELFAGIGACSKALTRLGIPHEIVDAVEIDKYAIKSFNAIHNTNFEPQDITKWDKDIECDLIMHGSPCQDFSVAGKQAGGDKDSGTRSSLMYETLRIVEKTMPKYVIWENVKNLVSKRHRHNYVDYLNAMNRLGYKNYGNVLNAKNYGIPQNRERVFTVSIREREREYEFPREIPLERKLKDMLETEVEEKYYLTDNQVASFQADSDNQVAKGYGFKFEPLDKEKDTCHTIATRSGSRKTDNFIMEDFYKNRPTRVYEEASPTLRSGRTGLKVITANTKGYPCNDLNGVIEHQASEYRIRKLTPKECWRLMGFDDSDFEKAEKVNSNTQLYKQAGNSIVVNVLEGILTNLLEGEQ